MTLRIVVDDLSREATRGLVAAHLTGMHALTPADSVHALDAGGLADPAITVWSAWQGDELVGIGALKQLDDARGELKSMRVDDRFRGTGAGRAILRHIMTEARARGIRSLWLETGAGDDFLPAQRLYASEGFVACGPFADYGPDPLSVFLTREL